MDRRILNKLRDVASRLHETSKRLPPKTFSTALIVAGAALMLFVASQYAQMHFEQQRLAKQWAEQQNDQAATPTAASAEDTLVRLVIPKIDLTSYVVEGTSRRSLLLGPGHMANTAIPGENGNAVITGHRDTFFRHIHELEKGDKFFVERAGKRYEYTVTGKRIVGPEEVAVTNPTSDAEITLITCYPTYYIGPAPKRLVVFSKLANQQQAAITVVKPVAHVETVDATTLH